MLSVGYLIRARLLYVNIINEEGEEKKLRQVLKLIKTFIS